MIFTKNKGQSFVFKSSWEGIADSIQENWNKDYYITDFDCGGGMYRVLFTKGVGWTNQTYLTSKTFPAEKVQKKWDEGYIITNVVNDSAHWFVIMSKGTGLSGQKWFTEKSFNDFKESVDNAWKEGYIITKVAYGNGLYLGVMSKGLDWGQHWWNWPHFPTDELIEEKKTVQKIITDVVKTNNMVFAVASSSTGYSKQRIHRNKDFEYLRKLLNNRWDEGYVITTVSYFQEEWILIFSK